MDDLDILFSAVTFLIGLVVLVLLWWAARHPGEYRPFWTWVAAGWTINWLGSLAWGLYEAIAGKDLPLFSLIDAFYLGRYLLVGWAIWRFPQALPGRRLSSMALTMAAATLIAWMAFDQTQAVFEQPVVYLLAVATYPVLDAGLLYALGLRFRGLNGTAHRKPFFWFAGAIVAYSAANWINYLGLIELWNSHTALKSILWLLCDVFVAVAAISYVRCSSEQGDRP